MSRIPKGGKFSRVPGRRKAPPDQQSSMYRGPDKVPGVLRPRGTEPGPAVDPAQQYDKDLPPARRRVRGAIEAYSLTIVQVQAGACEYTPPTAGCVATGIYRAQVSGDEGGTYAWSIVSGSATIQGPTDQETVTVVTDSTTNSTFTLQCIYTPADPELLPAVQQRTFTHLHEAISDLVVTDIVEDISGTCTYPPSGTCTAESQFTVQTTGGVGNLGYFWQTSRGTIISGQGTPTVTVEIDAGVTQVNFNMTCRVADDLTSEQITRPFNQIRDAGQAPNAPSDLALDLVGFRYQSEPSRPVVLFTDSTNYNSLDWTIQLSFYIVTPSPGEQHGLLSYGNTVTGSAATRTWACKVQTDGTFQFQHRNSGGTMTNINSTTPVPVGEWVTANIMVSASGVNLNTSWESGQFLGFTPDINPGETEFYIFTPTGSDIQGGIQVENVYVANGGQALIVATCSEGTGLVSESGGILGNGVISDERIHENRAGDDETADYVEVTFTDNADDEIGFELERSTDGTTFGKIADLPPEGGVGSTVFYLDDAINDGVTYWYRARAEGLFGFSDYSNTEFITIPGEVDNARVVRSGEERITRAGDTRVVRE